MPQKKLFRAIRIVAILTVVLVAAFFVWWFLIRQPPIPNNIIALSGRIEGDDSVVASKTSGRIREIHVREGDGVKAGDVIAILDDEQTAAREQQARAAAQQAETRVTHSQEQVGVLSEQLKQARFTVEQARLDAQGRVRQAEAQVATAEANLSQAQAGYEQARYDLEKFTRLAKSGDVSDRQREQARTTAEAQAAVVESTKRQVAASRGALTAARANLENPPIRSSQATAVQKQIAQAQSDVAAAQADAERANAQVLILLSSRRSTARLRRARLNPARLWRPELRSLRCSISVRSICAALFPRVTLLALSWARQRVSTSIRIRKVRSTLWSRASTRKLRSLQRILTFATTA